jgi:HTH-type transcriptional regulator/antitoxin HigA
MDIRAIKTNADYEATLHRIEELMDAKLNSPEGDELDILTTLVTAYEKTHFPIEAPDPIEFVKNVMEFRGYTQKDLALVLNSRSRASELLNKQRPLTLDQIRKISACWRLPAESLIQEYELTTQAG